MPQAPAIFINEYTGGGTGHVDVTFVDANGNKFTYGENLANNEFASDGLTGSSGGVFVEDGWYNVYKPASSLSVPVTQAQWNSAIAFADQQLDATADGKGSYDFTGGLLGGNNCVNFAQSVLDAAGVTGNADHISSYLPDFSAVQVYGGLLDYFRGAGSITPLAMSLTFSNSDQDVGGSPSGPNSNYISTTRDIYNNLVFDVTVPGGSGLSAESGSMTATGQLASGNFNLGNVGVTVAPNSTITNLTGGSDRVTLNTNDVLTANGNNYVVSGPSNSVLGFNGTGQVANLANSSIYFNSGSTVVTAVGSNDNLFSNGYQGIVAGVNGVNEHAYMDNGSLYFNTATTIATAVGSGNTLFGNGFNGLVAGLTGTNESVRFNNGFVYENVSNSVTSDYGVGNSLNSNGYRGDTFNVNGGGDFGNVFNATVNLAPSIGSFTLIGTGVTVNAGANDRNAISLGVAGGATGTDTYNWTGTDAASSASTTLTYDPTSSITSLQTDWTASGGTGAQVDQATDYSAGGSQYVLDNPMTGVTSAVFDYSGTNESGLETSATVYYSDGYSQVNNYSYDNSGNYLGDVANDYAPGGSLYASADYNSYDQQTGDYGAASSDYGDFSEDDLSTPALGKSSSELAASLMNAGQVGPAFAAEAAFLQAQLTERESATAGILAPANVSSRWGSGPITWSFGTGGGDWNLAAGHDQGQALEIIAAGVHAHRTRLHGPSGGALSSGMHGVVQRAQRQIALVIGAGKPLRRNAAEPLATRDIDLVAGGDLESGTGRNGRDGPAQGGGGLQHWGSLRDRPAARLSLSPGASRRQPRDSDSGL